MEYHIIDVFLRFHMIKLAELQQAHQAQLDLTTY